MQWIVFPILLVRYCLKWKLPDGCGMLWTRVKKLVVLENGK